MTAQLRRRPFPFWSWAHRLTAASFFLLLVAAGGIESFWLRGTPTATRLLGVVPFVDPLAAVESIVASRSWTTTLLVGMGASSLVAILLGRVFCGWLCPLGLVLDINALLRQRLWRRNSPEKPRGADPIGGVTKYGLLAFIVVLSLISALPVFTMVSPINLVVLGFSLASWVALAIVAAIALLEQFLPRLFCRSLCPAGAFYSLLGRFAVWRVQIHDAQRLHCEQCTLHCPMGIDVMHKHVLAGKSQVDDPECTRCGLCTEVCAGNVLRLGFHSPCAPQHAKGLPVLAETGGKSD